MPLKIRQAKAEDIPVLMAVFQAAVRGSCGADYMPEQIDAWVGRSTVACFQKLFDSGLCFFVVENATVCAGYAAVSAQGELHSLFVVPEFQRQGVARTLLDAALHFVRELGAQTLYADVSLTALPFFRQAGFDIMQEQQVSIGKVCLTNYRMRRTI